MGSLGNFQAGHQMNRKWGVQEPSSYSRYSLKERMMVVVHCTQEACSFSLELFIGMGCLLMSYLANI
jgi:hypothetical protein